jgi:GMP synthase-like glutamine amidotransferase
MKVAILETGKPPEPLIARFGDYPSMFAQLLAPDFETVRYEAQTGELPDRPDAHDAYLITGSPGGVYEPLPWIAPLRDFLRATSPRTKLVGICFGHQLMAEAFGGRVEKSGKGWGVGLHRYEVKARESWMDSGRSLSIPVSHQDQVVEQPPRTRILAANDFTPVGMLGWEDRAAMSMQFHPEFEPDYARALIALRRDRLSGAEAAIASLSLPNDRDRVAGWIKRFLA